MKPEDFRVCRKNMRNMYLVPAAFLILLGTVVFNITSPSRASTSFLSLISFERSLNNMAQAVELEALLKRASYDKKTPVIITTLNQAWAEKGSMIDLFLGSFHIGMNTSHLLNHLVIVAMDQFSYERCRDIHKHCFSLKTSGVDFTGEKFFMSEDFVKMMWTRVRFLQSVLEMGYSYIFTDADILWFRDPLKHLNSSIDIQLSSDSYTGDPTSVDNQPNTGFLQVRANNRTIELYKLWYRAREIDPHLNEQMVFSNMKETEEFKSLGLSMKYLPTEFFGGFCELGKDLNKICTVHANCCTSLTRKMHDLQLIVDDWKRYIGNKTHSQTVEWRAPQDCLLSFAH